MKRIILATAGVAVFAVFAATLGSAQPTATTGPARADATPVLPKLPADIAKRKRFIIGVKCDTPPFGYLDVRGKNAGVDVEIAKWFARYAFGREQRLTFVCAPTAVRWRSRAVRGGPGRSSRPGTRSAARGTSSATRGCGRTPT